MHKVFAYMTKCDDITAEQFREHYENNHVPLVLSFAPLPKVYKRDYLIRGDGDNLEDPSIDFDCVTELTWDDRSGSEEWRRLLGREEIATDGERFLDRARTRAYPFRRRSSRCRPSVELSPECSPCSRWPRPRRPSSWSC